jgi:hypothetical protein
MGLKRLGEKSLVLQKNRNFSFFSAQFLFLLLEIEKKMFRVSARRLFIYNFAWGLQKTTKKVYLVPKKLAG